MRLKGKNTKWVVHHDCLSHPVQGNRKFERRRVAVKETGLGALDYGQNCWQYWPSTSCPRAMGTRVKEVYILVGLILVFDSSWDSAVSPFSVPLMGGSGQSFDSCD
jgi:hypothetical protein